VQKLNTEINALMKKPTRSTKIARPAFDPVVKNVAETNDYFKSEVASWGKMVNAIGFSN
jgi:tripartite-type tricarboxylate transporter receptor subunit TctC